MFVCPKCGSPVTAPESTRFCNVCNYVFLNAPAAQPIAAGNTGGRTRHIAWEDVQVMGVFNALAETLRKSLLDPHTFFCRLANSNNTTMAWLYALLLGSIGSLISFIWTMALITPIMKHIPGLQDYAGSTAITTISLLLAPAIVTLKLVFATLYFHGLVFLTRTNKQPMAATFRVICYTQSTAIFELIPVFGGIISPLWSLYLLAVGFNKIHKLSVFKALLLILLPLILITGICAVGLVLLLAAGFAMTDVMGSVFSMFGK